jgi:hypothetical protein
MPFRPGTLTEIYTAKSLNNTNLSWLPHWRPVIPVAGPGPSFNAPSPDDGPGATIVPTRLFEFQFLLNAHYVGA